MKVGDIVVITLPVLGEPIGTRGYIYEVYQFSGLHGVSVITENNVNLGGFSMEEAKTMLAFVGTTPFIYEFTNVIQLGIDAGKGYFKMIFDLME